MSVKLVVPSLGTEVTEGIVVEWLKSVGEMVKEGEPVVVIGTPKLNLEVEAPVTGASVAIFYASGVVFAISASVITLRELWRTATGRISDAELVAVQESEDLAQVDELHLDRSGTYKNR